MTDHCGLMLALAVHPGDVQDRDGFGLVASKQTRRRFPFIEVIFADGGYRGDKVRETAAGTGTWRVEIITRNEADVGFVVQARRWIVERTLAWISRHRRLAKDLECLTRTAIAFVRLAMIKIMLRRLGRQRRE